MNENGTKRPSNPGAASAHAVTSNTGQPDRENAPPSVPAAPSADTRGASGTSTAEGPAHPKAPIPDGKETPSVRHRSGEGTHEVSAPGERVDDEATDGKVTKRHE